PECREIDVCSCSGSNNNYGWYQQKTPGSASVTVLTPTPWDKCKKLSISWCSFMSTFPIVGIQAEDVAVYPCGSRDSSGSLVQAALTQPASVSANLGGTVTITCSGSSSNYGWYQQKSPGSAPVTVIYQNTRRPSRSLVQAALTQPASVSANLGGTVQITCSGGSLVEAGLTQPASVSANPGETVKITCSGGIGQWYGWYQQKSPGSVPVTVINANTYRPPNIPSRFSGSLSVFTHTLTITGVQAEDEAVYYCGSYDSSYAGIVPWGDERVDLMARAEDDGFPPFSIMTFVEISCCDGVPWFSCG
ncbi:hypothetical protein CIB84_011133, partial [Bambusicola thoracicus]